MFGGLRTKPPCHFLSKRLTTQSSVKAKLFDFENNRSENKSDERERERKSNEGKTEIATMS